MSTAKRTRRSRVQQLRDSPAPRRSPRLSQKYYPQGASAGRPLYSRASMRTYTSASNTSVLNESGQSVPSTFDDDDTSSITTASTLDSEDSSSHYSPTRQQPGSDWQLEYTTSSTGSTIVTSSANRGGANRGGGGANTEAITKLYGLDSDDEDEEYRPHVYTVHNMERVLTPKRVSTPSTPSHHHSSSGRSCVFMLFAAIFQLFYRAGSAIYLTTTSILCYDVAVLHRLSRGFRMDERRHWQGFVVMPVVMVILLIALVVPHLESPPPAPPPVSVVVPPDTPTVTFTVTPSPTPQVNLTHEILLVVEDRLQQHTAVTKIDMEQYILQLVNMDEIRRMIRDTVDDERRSREEAIAAVTKSLSDKLASHSAELEANWKSALDAAVLASGTGVNEQVMEDTVNRIVTKSNAEMMDKMAAAKKNWISEVESTVSDVITALRREIEQNKDPQKLSLLEASLASNDDWTRQQVQQLLDKINTLSDDQAKLRATSSQLEGSVSDMASKQRDIEGHMTSLKGLIKDRVAELIAASNITLGEDMIHKIVMAEMVKLFAESEKKLEAKLDSSFNSKGAPPSYPKISDAYIQSLIDAALARYSADRIAMFDHALDSAGGIVIDSSPTYDPLKTSSSLFGVPIPAYLTMTTPTVIIQPEVLPGDCWCFEGSTGFATITLANVVTVTGVTVEHIPVSLSPVGETRSAPKDFTVLAKSSADSQPHTIGSFSYSTGSSSPIQTFDIEKNKQRVVSQVTFQFQSNHGNNYTCVYRVRVHGNAL